MKLSDGTILMHGKEPYDPVKAHDYYLRTRHLKGRHKGRTVNVRSHTRNVSRGNYTVILPNGKTVTLSKQQLVEQEAYAAKRVNDIKNRLHELSTKLHELLRKAEKQKTNTNKKPTVADKRKAAQKSKQYRQKHKQQLANKAKTAKSKHPSKKTTTSKDPVAELKSKITQIKSRLQDAINIQRALTAAKPNG